MSAPQVTSATLLSGGAGHRPRQRPAPGKDNVMKLALFGGTGTAGTALLEQALDAGHDVQMLARAPAKISRSRSHAQCHRRRRERPRRRGCDAQRLRRCSDGPRRLRRPGQHPDRDRADHLSHARGRHPAYRDRPGIPPGFPRRSPQPRPEGHPAAPVARQPHPDPRLPRHGRRHPGQRPGLDRHPGPPHYPGGPTGRARVGQLKLGPFNSVTNGDIAELALRSLTDATTIGTAPMIANGGTQTLGAAGYWLLGRRPFSNRTT